MIEALVFLFSAVYSEQRELWVCTYLSLDSMVAVSVTHETEECPLVLDVEIERDPFEPAM